MAVCFGRYVKSPGDSGRGCDVVLCRITAARDAGGCGGVRALRAGGELGGKLGGVLAALHTARACAGAGLAAVESKTTGVVFAGAGADVVTHFMQM
jgi:hypothetical protein